MENKTFRPGSQPHLNAVVGSSWSGNNDYSYVIGFEQAVEVLLAAAVEESYTDPITQDQKAVYIDALIYPICFCARHFIELFLKRQIGLVSRLRGSFDDAAGTHDLASLWSRLEGHLSVDRRLRPLASPMSEFIKDFANVDQTGETFRYAFDLQNNSHLSDISHINIAILADRLQKLRKYAEEFELQIEILRDEYRQGTFTSKLSREDLRQIAARLPPFDAWNSEAFDAVKISIKDEFHLGSNDFSKALNIIKQHREFSSLIGVEIPLEGLTVDVLDRAKAIFTKHNAYESISKEEWARLAAICEIGRIGEYSEAYDFLPTLYLSDEHEARIFPSDVLREMMGRHNRFRIGLRKLGQTTLAERFENLFPRVVEEPRRTPDDLRETFKKQLESLRVTSEPKI